MKQKIERAIISSLESGS